MSTHHRQANEFVQRMLRSRSIEQAKRDLSPKPCDGRQKIPGGSLLTDDAIRKRYEVIANADQIRADLLEDWTNERKNVYEHNIENFIGTVKVPVGLAGPLRINGLCAHGDFYLPLATTEAALVASYSRGCQIITEAGGCTAMLLNEGLSRAPGFVFKDLKEAGSFLIWVINQLDAFRKVAEATTRYGKLIDMSISVEGNHVYLLFEFTTGDAAGQNMVTIAAQAICDYINKNSPVKPQRCFVEANLSGDKKASAASFVSVRGKKVTAEVVLPGELVHHRLHTTPVQMCDYWRMSAMGAILSGTMGVQGHFANGLAALYIACGQDAACVAESAVGTTRMEVTPDGGLYTAVTLPNLIVGTVGGGTMLPTQKACLDILKLSGPGNAQALAEVCASMALAGELSIIAALSCGHFTRAHERRTRTRNNGQSRS
ncbi:MAG TPA: hydroxymethylglutaryl-CoA reductase [Tepidisphaeraceae bacterium]|nr:hydroxymethylglutaryl-CoA reductase [Tepidisphaeraceae bacterium]